MRAGEGLVDVVVHHVAAEIAGPRDAHDRVHVGPVDVDQSSRVVHPLGDRLDLSLEQPQRIGVGDHEHRRVRSELLLEIVDIDQSVLA